MRYLVIIIALLFICTVAWSAQHCPLCEEYGNFMVKDGYCSKCKRSIEQRIKKQKVLNQLRDEGMILTTEEEGIAGKDTNVKNREFKSGTTTTDTDNR